MSDGTWMTCLCGKERWIWYRTEASMELLSRLGPLIACKQCEITVQQELDMCPESMPTENGGVVACGGAWNHEGRCYPIVFRDEILTTINDSDEFGPVFKA